MIFLRQITLSLTLFLNALLVFISFFEDKVRVPVFLQVTGRLHPAIVHFPLALLFIVIFIEWLSSSKKFQHPLIVEINDYMLYAFSLSAVLGALFGFFLYKEGGYQGEDINLHRWLGTTVSILSAFILILRKSYKAYYYGFLAITAVCLTVAGHIGSEVTHGKGFVMEPVRRQQKRIEIENPDSAVVFRDVIQPILNEKCVSCHNANKAKNDLILTDYKDILNGGENSGAIVTGAAEKSLVYKYVRLPMSDTLHMPPEGKLQLDREEIKLIGWWINSGANEHEKYVHMNKVDSIQTIMLSKFQPKKGLDLLNISFADPSKIKSLSNPYRNVSQISKVKPYIAVFLGSKKDFTANDLKELNGISQQIVSIDLGNSAITDADVKTLSEFPHLQKLHLQNTSIHDVGVKNLRSLQYLEFLNLSGTKITGKTLDEISEWNHVKKLYIYNTSVETASIENLRKANSLVEVFNTQLDLTDSIYNAKLTAPIIKIDSQFFRSRAMVEIKPSRGKVNYYYTLDGIEPTSGAAHYTVPFEIKQTVILKIVATMKGWGDSKVVTYQLMKVGITPDVIELETNADPKLSAKKDSVLVDGKSGSLDRGDKAYLAFVTKDFDAIFQTKNSVKVSQVALSFLQDMNQGVYAPEYVEIWGGMEKNKLEKLGKVSIAQTENKSAEKGLSMISFAGHELKFLRVKAKNVGILPTKHPLIKTAKATLCIDEVTIN
ncbi:MAG: FN3 associated domain-containing protein [Chryseolinea sp.]